MFGGVVHSRWAVVCVLSLCASSALAGNEEKVSAQVPAIRKLAADPKLVAAVKAQNAKKTPMAEIQKLDEQWKASAGVAAFMKPILENDCAKALKAGIPTIKGAAEVFAMDDQGGLVGATRKTSDYWQGDEAKWQKSFAGGKGAEFVDKPQFDDSTQDYVVQVSVPVMDGGKAIGAITVSLNLEQL